MPLIHPQALLFDLDDTLWPIGPVIAQAELSWHAWLAEYAPRVASQFTIAALRERRMALLAQRPELIVDLARLRRVGLEEAFALAGEDARHIDGAIRHFLDARNAVTPYDDVLPALARLRTRLRLGTITNGNADLEAIGLAHHFEATLAAPQFGCAKPDPAIFLAGCAALGVAPEAAVYVGDDLRLDVAGAQQAGLRAVWLNRSGSDAHLELGITPDAICATLDELETWLHQLAED
ncbi:MAG TPA: HAD family hydrolase [Burkholderiaceae bacterium]|nr:HAD family hydrolase [Burkholderiaceae bacterium]